MVLCQKAELIAIVLSALVLSFAQSFTPHHPQSSSFQQQCLTKLSVNLRDALEKSRRISQQQPAVNLLDALDTSTSTPLCSGEVVPMMWEDTSKLLSKNAFRVGLPPNLLGELRAYANRMGITDFYRKLVVEDRPYNPGTENVIRFQGYKWMVQRPKSHWASNMHWTSPADEEAHDDYLRVLSAGGFDEVLEGVGTYFGLEALSAYHLSFIGVSQCEKGFIHADVTESGTMAFNMIIPLILEDEGPELEILSDDETTTRYYKYEYNVASMVGDNALHATASCDYQEKGTMRMAATVYVGDITPGNVNNLLLSLTQAYPPVGNAQHLLDRAGSHW
eukprot:CAMPEP_0194398958 /NCGR_PEP_ID=MMETSP0174-20130528/126395_1 /TAXON_ID=216777 /ORGANISM="Proboscia alata, Strain PI-D3" /LENGTH=333 /DNA_ID=CAMNT_0039195317 /DNA_START=883 /DNA_END=1881 /DNA_ORIENTATION=-